MEEGGGHKSEELICRLRREGGDDKMGATVRKIKDMKVDCVLIGLTGWPDASVKARQTTGSG